MNDDQIDKLHESVRKNTDVLINVPRFMNMELIQRMKDPSVELHEVIEYLKNLRETSKEEIDTLENIIKRTKNPTIMVKSKILRMHRMCVDYAKQYD